ncbi:putative holin-like toxin [Listeria booriae]|nr:putative holin-like toxin [Listeria booriae]
MEVGTAIEIMLAFGIYTLALLTYVKNDRKKWLYNKCWGRK